MKSMRSKLYCAVAVSAVFGQLLAFGANSNLLAVASSELVLLAAAGCLIAEARANSGDAADLHRAAAGPLLLLLAAAVWALLPVLAPGLAPPRVRPDAIIVELVKLAALGALTLLGAHIGRSPRGLHLAVSWLLYAGVAYLLVSLWLWRDNPTEVWGQLKGRHLGRFTATLLNANAAACVCAAVVLLGLAQLHSTFEARGRALTVERLVETGVAATAVLVGVFAIFLTASRAACLALGLLAVVQAVTAGRDRTDRWRRALAVCVLGGATLAAAVALRGAATLDRPFSTEDSYVRVAGYDVAWKLMQQQPIFGYGLGSYRLLNQSHVPPADADYIWDLGAAHQPILQAGLEGGAPFAVAIVGAIAWLTVSALHPLLKPHRERSLAVGAILSSALIFAVAQIDIALNVPATASLAMLLLGLAWGWSVGRRAKRPDQSAARPAVP